VEESVVAKVLAALTSLCELGLFQKMRIWELMSATLGFLYHPNIWIRQGLVVCINLEFFMLTIDGTYSCCCFHYDRWGTPPSQ